MRRIVTSLFLWLGAVFLLNSLTSTAFARGQYAGRRGITSSNRIWLDGGLDFGVWMKNPGVVHTLENIPGLVHHHRVRLIEGWKMGMELAKLHPNLEAMYAKRFGTVEKKLEDDTATAYDHLLPKNEVAKGLEKNHVQVNENYVGYLPRTTYLLKDPYIYDGVLTFTVSSVCVKGSQFVPTSPYLAPNVLGIPPCQGGKVYSVYKIAHVHYDPYCVDAYGYRTYCTSPDELKKPIWIDTIYTGAESD